MDPLRIYQHHTPGKLIFGQKSLNELAKEIPAKEMPLIVTDQGVSKSGILKKVTDVLKETEVRFHVFDGIEPDPPWKLSKRLHLFINRTAVRS